ncbi:MAG: response regulator [Gammaproteobacteria bacterium]|nr:response regulator [Gammaproteobacteria bacterium]
MSTKTIMLVEDNPDDEALTLHAFEKNNISNKVVVMRNGADALDYLTGPGAQSRELPTVVLLDLKLPKVDGLEVLRRIREHERTRILPVVILTSSKEQQDLIAGYRFGCNAYVRKPVDFDEFLQAARQLGLFWLLTNSPPPAL